MARWRSDRRSVADRISILAAEAKERERRRLALKAKRAVLRNRRWHRVHDPKRPARLARTKVREACARLAMTPEVRAAYLKAHPRSRLRALILEQHRDDRRPFEAAWSFDLQAYPQPESCRVRRLA